MMVQKITLNADNTKGICFESTGNHLSVRQFFGMKGANNLSIPESAGLFFLDTDLGRLESDRWLVDSLQADERLLQARLMDQDKRFSLDMRLERDEATGVFSRKDTLTNLDSRPHVIYACVARIPLHGDDFELYAQASGWCAENNGGWQDIQAGNSELINSTGRSTDTCTPFACIRQKRTGLAAAIHVLPVGDWVIRVRRIAGSQTTYAVLEAGLSDRGLRLELAPGEKIELPELLFYGFSGAIEDSTASFHRYLVRRFTPKVCPEPVYNTWFFEFDTLEVDRLRQQLARARQIGCRYFVIDAGWFGRGPGWSTNVGDWREATAAAFRGGMRDFADEVRAAGLNFGLWMEPERACADTDVCREHPDWFMRGDAIIYDLAQPQVREYLFNEISRLIRTYDLSWMKVDFNLNMTRDLTGSNFYRYYAGFGLLMAEVIAANPGCYFEGCSSGGLRTDIVNTLSRFGNHFISDTVNPVTVLRMRQNGALRILPQYLGAWAALYEAPVSIGSYTLRNRRSRSELLVSADATWSEVMDLTADFTAKALIAGAPGLTGDLAALSEQTVDCFRNLLAFYSQHRELISHSVCHPLSQIGRIDNETGWVVFQYENIDGQGSLIFAFRLKDNVDTFICHPRNLDRATAYRIAAYGGTAETADGGEIARNGLEICCPSYHSAQIILIQPADTAE